MLAIDVITGPGGFAADPAAPAGGAPGRLMGDAFKALLAMGEGATPQSVGQTAAKPAKGLLGADPALTAAATNEGAEGLLAAAAFVGAAQPAQPAPTTAGPPAEAAPKSSPKGEPAPAMTALKAALSVAAGTDKAPVATDADGAATPPTATIAQGETPEGAAPAPAAVPSAKTASDAAVQTLARSGAPVLTDPAATPVTQRRAAEVQAEGDRRTERQTALKGPTPTASPDAGPAPAASGQPQAQTQGAASQASLTDTGAVEAASPDAAAAPAPDAAEVPADPALEPLPEAPRADVAAREAQRPAVAPSGLARATIETTAMLAAGIARRLEGRSTRFELGLTPEGLGKVDVSIEVGDDGQLMARLAFDNPAAAAEMRARADELRRQLTDAGFQLAGDALEFSERQGGDASSHDAWGRDRSAFAGAARVAEAADAQPGPWISLSVAREGVDLKV